MSYLGVYLGEYLGASILYLRSSVIVFMTSFSQKITKKFYIETSFLSGLWLRSVLNFTFGVDWLIYQVKKVDVKVL